MIDVENQIITDVINGFVGTDYANINIASDPPQKAEFPYVLFYQSDAYPTRGTHIASREDTFETVVFTADIYSNKANNAEFMPFNQAQRKVFHNLSLAEGFINVFSFNYQF